VTLRAQRPRGAFLKGDRGTPFPRIARLSGAPSRHLLPKFAGFRICAANAGGVFPAFMRTRYSGPAVRDDGEGARRTRPRRARSGDTIGPGLTAGIVRSAIVAAPIVVAASGGCAGRRRSLQIVVERGQLAPKQLDERRVAKSLFKHSEASPEVRHPPWRNWTFEVSPRIRDRGTQLSNLRELVGGKHHQSLGPCNGDLLPESPCGAGNR
jgi:hypothetical protein